MHAFARRGLAAATLFASAGSACAGGPAVDLWLTILHNNDGESQLISAPDEPDFGGVARFATLVDDLRAEAATFPAGATANGSLLISAGDNYLAGPEFNASLNLPAGTPFFDAVAMEMIGYDVAAIGNHEFDFGPDVFQAFLQGFTADRPTFISSNLDFTGEPGLQALVGGRIAPSVVLDVQGRQVGVIGATTPNLPFITTLRNVTVSDVAAAVQSQVNTLRGSGVEIIIVASHLQSVDEELALATQLTGVDAFIAGGGDDLIADAGTALIPGDSIDRVGYPLTATDPDNRTVYVVATPGNYTYVGRLILGFDAAGEVVAVADESNLVRVSGVGDDAVAADAAIQTMVVDPVAASVAGLAANVIAQSAVPLDAVTGRIRSRETNEGNLVADAFLYIARREAQAFGVARADVALANGGGIRNNSVIPAGPLTELNTFEILPFSNVISVVEGVSREQFKDIMENAVARIQTGTGNASGSGTGRFAQVAGMTMTYDPAGAAIVLDADENTLTPGSRVRSIVLDSGEVIVADGAVVPGDDLTVATVDFLAGGGDQYPFRGLPFTRVGVSYQRALFEYLTEFAGVDGVVTTLRYPQGGEGRIVNSENIPCNTADLGRTDGRLGFLDVNDVIEFVNTFNAGCTE